MLKAYTLYRPEEGYCQAQAPIAAVLLMHMPAEQAFWCLVQICEKYLPGYYSEKLVSACLDPGPRLGPAPGWTPLWPLQASLSIGTSAPI